MLKNNFWRCTEARAAGYENIKRGEPGYATKLDRDKDGVACESKLILNIKKGLVSPVAPAKLI